MFPAVIPLFSMADEKGENPEEGQSILLGFSAKNIKVDGVTPIDIFQKIYDKPDLTKEKGLCLLKKIGLILLPSRNFDDSNWFFGWSMVYWCSCC